MAFIGLANTLAKSTYIGKYEI